jgi:hypothetical protein
LIQVNLLLSKLRQELLNFLIGLFFSHFIFDPWHFAGKRSTEPLSHFRQSSGGYGIYATRLSMVWLAAGRVLMAVSPESLKLVGGWLPSCLLARRRKGSREFVPPTAPAECPDRAA